MAKIELPRIYIPTENTPAIYHQYEGKPKISYSQKTAWNDVQYHNEYIKQYFEGIPSVDNIFNVFGSEVGEYIEHKAKGIPHKTDVVFLQDEDREILDKLDYPENSIYEDEIVIDMGDYVIQGFTDRTEYYNEGKVKKVGIRDYKTGNVVEKAKFYASDEYNQTTLYSYQKDLEGYEIGYSHVYLLGRKGNNMMYKNGLARVRLTGENKLIDTPYSRERAEAVLKSFDKTVKEISDTYKVFKKYFK